MMNQRTAVCSTLLSLLAERGVKYELNGPTPISEVLNAKDKATVRDIIFAGFRKGEIAMDAESAKKYVDDAEMRKYVSGLVNNWVNKAPEFNSGKKHTAKNPGSRAGSKDESIQQMKALLGQTSDPAHKKLIEDAISARLAEIKPTKEVEINADKLPESLRHLVK